MKIWLPKNAGIKPTFTSTEIGLYIRPNEKPVSGALVSVSAQTEINVNLDVAAWLVPAGLSGDFDLIKRIAKTTCPIMVALNGLGARTYNALAELKFTGARINLFDARSQDSVSFLEQLVWLSHQTYPFAIIARSTDELLQAAAVGAAHLIVPEHTSLDLCLVERIIGAAQASADRPTTAIEIDHLVGHEVSLIAKHSLSAGATLRANDITTQITKVRGLSPSLKSEIIGRTLRYDIAEEEPINFGHLEKKLKK